MINNDDTKYDFIVSLGGNCSVAFQLKRRNLRKFSSPFDWFFFGNEEEYNKIINAFKNDFKNCFLKENLVELVGEERGNSAFYQYKDLISGYRIIHLFKEPITKKGAYEKYSSIIFRRLNRFYECCKKSDSICFVLALYFELDKSKYLELFNVLKERFSDKNIKLIVKNFNCDKEEVITPVEGLEIHRHTRQYHLYDYFSTSVEWSFLDKINRLRHKEKYFVKWYFSAPKRTFTISIFGFVNRFFQFKMYLLGLTFELSLGRFINAD